MSLAETHIERDLGFEYDLGILAGVITGLPAMENPDNRGYLYANGSRTISLAHPTNKILKDAGVLLHDGMNPRALGETYLERAAEGAQHFGELAVLASQDHLLLDILGLAESEIRGALWSGLDRRTSAVRAELVSHELHVPITTIDRTRRACLPRQLDIQQAEIGMRTMMRLQKLLVAPIGVKVPTV